MALTHEQDAIRQEASTLKDGDGLRAIAFAGAGKTTTLKAVAGARPDRGVYLAFNKSIAADAKSKLAATRCTASTMHALAYKAVMDGMKLINVNANAIRDSGVMRRFYVPQIKGFGEYRVAAGVGRTMAAFANSDDRQFTIEHAREALIGSLDDPDLIKDRLRAEQARDIMGRLAEPIFQIAAAAWTRFLEDGQLSHDMYLKTLDLDDASRGNAFRGFKYLMVDEAQDINPVQRSIITKLGIPIIAVGDPYQQIYSWRGGENALELLPGRKMYLTQSFRFGDGPGSIAEVARHILSIRPDGGPEQRLIGAGGHLNKDKMQGAKVAVICRTNMGVLDEALGYMRKGKKIHVDNMASLMEDILSAQALHDGDLRHVTSQSIEPFNNWRELELEAEEGGDSALSRLVTIIEDGMVPDIQRLSNYQQNDVGKSDIAICTAHRSKGLEFPAVMLGGDWKDAHKMRDRYMKAQTKSEKDVTAAIEEYNALYVASTRAIVRLSGHQPVFFPQPREELEAAPAL